MIRECLIFLAIASAAALTGCGGDDEEPAGLEHDVHVHLDEWSVETEPESIAGAGTVNIGGHNHGKYPHQVTVIKTDLAADALPTLDDGSFDEEGEGVEVVDEIEDIAAGADGEVTANLESGGYILLCNLVEEEDSGETESHYEEGMHAAFTVQ